MNINMRTRRHDLPISHKKLIQLNVREGTPKNIEGSVLSTSLNQNIDISEISEELALESPVQSLQQINRVLGSKNIFIAGRQSSKNRSLGNRHTAADIRRSSRIRDNDTSCEPESRGSPRKMSARPLKLKLKDSDRPYGHYASSKSTKSILKIPGSFKLYRECSSRSKKLVTFAAE